MVGESSSMEGLESIRSCRVLRQNTFSSAKHINADVDTAAGAGSLFAVYVAGSTKGGEAWMQYVPQ